MSFLFPQAFIFLLLLAWLWRKGSQKAWLLHLVLLFLILSLARPALKEAKQHENLQGKEFIIALDVSYSMQASDIYPSRLERAKEIIKEILAQNPQDRFSLYAFTTNPLILSPSTSDHQLLLHALNALKVDNILTHGSNLQALFDHINKLKVPEKNLILLSDGGEEEKLDTYSINLISVTLASPLGSFLENKYGKKLRDHNGHLIITKTNPLLARISTHTFKHDSEAFNLDFVKNSTTTQKEHFSYLDLYWIPLLLALLLFMAHYIRLPKKIVALIPFLALQSDASMFDWYHIERGEMHYHDKNYKEAIAAFEQIQHQTLQSKMNIANSYYQAGAYAKASSLYSTLTTTNPKLKKNLLYKLGNCAAKEDDYDSAKAYYLEALQFGEDADILHNLRLLEKKKAAKDPSKKKDGEDTKKAKNSVKNNKQSKGDREGESGDASAQNSRPLGFKAYELINKGYINEKKPW